MGFPEQRLRRLRRTPALRDLVAETTLSPDDLIAPLFVKEGLTGKAEIESLPGVYQLGLDEVVKEAGRLVGLGIKAVLLFGVPAHRSENGAGACDPMGVVQQSARRLREAYDGRLVVMADLCLDEFTLDGQCGVPGPTGLVDNDSTLELYRAIAVSQAEAGVEVVAPSGMMDGQVAAIRSALDSGGHTDVAIMAYAAKFASNLYGPFRDAVEVTLTRGDRRSYQQDYRNAREAMAEVALDVAEGADILMVKPGLAYLDVLAAVATRYPHPLAAYQVSGEYAMVQAAAARGWLDLESVMLEELMAFRRAGASLIITYFAPLAAAVLA